MNILLICGSAREKSFNRKLSVYAKEALSKRADVKTLDFSGVPFFSQDIEEPVPDAVGDARDAFDWADAVWFFTPEYNGEIPGRLKNLLDWISRPLPPTYARENTPAYGKPAAVSGAGGSRATKSARGHLDELLNAMGMKVCPDQTGIKLDEKEFKEDVFEHPEAVRDKIGRQADAFLAWMDQKGFIPEA